MVKAIHPLLLLCWCTLSLTNLSIPRSSRRSFSLGLLLSIILTVWLDHARLLLWLDNRNTVWQTLLGTTLALRIRTAHDLDLDTENTLSEQNVAGSRIDEVLGRLTRVNHEAIGKLHALGTRSPQLARNDDLATLGTALHDEAQDTVARTTHGQTVKQLVAERLALCDSGETTVLHLSGVQRDGVFGELEALLDEGGEFADAAALLAQNLLGVGGADDNVGHGGGNAHFDARVALLGEFALEELVQFSVEDSIGDKLSPLRTVGEESVSCAVDRWNIYCCI